MRSGHRQGHDAARLRPIKTTTPESPQGPTVKPPSSSRPPQAPGVPPPRRERRPVTGGRQRGAGRSRSSRARAERRAGRMPAASTGCRMGQVGRRTALRGACGGGGGDRRVARPLDAERAGDHAQRRRPRHPPPRRAPAPARAVAVAQGRDGRSAHPARRAARAGVGGALEGECEWQGRWAAAGASAAPHTREARAADPQRASAPSRRR